MKMKTSRVDVSPLRYPGGKRKLSGLIGSVVEEVAGRPSLFVEPFAGGAAVAIDLLENNLVERIALSDLDELVAAFWNCVFSRDADDLADMIEGCAVDVPTWKTLKTSTPEDRLGRAFKCLYLNRTSFSGSLHRNAGPVGGVAQGGQYKIDARFNRARVAARVRQLATQKERVAFVENCDYRTTAAKVTQMREDKRNVVFYVDPPFFAKAERLYRRAFSTADHENLASFVETGFPGRWILSYDAHPDAVRIYSKHPGYKEVDLTYSAARGATKRPASTEILVSDMIEELRASGQEITEMTKVEMDFTGKVSKVTPDGRFAIVTLDSALEGRSLAVVGPDTKGRLSLMGEKGGLEAGLAVKGLCYPGPDAMSAVSVQAL